MATCVRRKWFLLTILGIALLAGAVVVRVEGAKPPPPPPPPPVNYGIQFWTFPQGDGSVLNKMNNLGQVVGRCWGSNGTAPNHGFIYDPSVDPDTAIDLNDLNVAGFPPPPAGYTGWMIGSAVGINDNGVVVGYLQPVNTGSGAGPRMGYILDT